MKFTLAVCTLLLIGVAFAFPNPDANPGAENPNKEQSSGGAQQVNAVETEDLAETMDGGDGSDLETANTLWGGYGGYGGWGGNYYRPHYGGWGGGYGGYRRGWGGGWGGGYRGYGGYGGYGGYRRGWGGGHHYWG